MKVSKLIFALGLLTASSLSGIAVAHEQKAAGYEHGRYMQHSPVKRMLAGLNLTDSQREQIKQLMQQHRSGQKNARPDNTRQQMRDLMAADTFDEVAARILLEAQQQQAVDKRLAALQLRHQVLQVLTAEQRQQLREKRQQWQQKKQQRGNS